MNMTAVETKVLEIKQLIHNWSQTAKLIGKEHRNKIVEIAFASEYDRSQESYLLTDGEQLMEIWKLVNEKEYEPAEFLEETKRILYM